MKNNTQLSENEMVSYLRTTSIPTILVEGNDECSVYRYLEKKIKIEGVGILPCGGRDMLIKIFKRRNEFKNAKVVFVADKDMWFFTGIPEEYENKIVFTTGYSLENDLYNKGLFESLLEDKEARDFHHLIGELSIWFASEVERYIRTGQSLCDFHVEKICPQNNLCENFKETIGFIDPPVDLVKMISQEYTKALRGKNLFEALLKFLSNKKRPSKYNRRNLIELGTKADNQCLQDLINIIADKFGEHNNI